jgi:hypothetical protein
MLFKASFITSFATSYSTPVFDWLLNYNGLNCATRFEGNKDHRNFLTAA